jgi:hypothetical protein
MNKYHYKQLRLHTGLTFHDCSDPPRDTIEPRHCHTFSCDLHVYIHDEQCIATVYQNQTNHTVYNSGILAKNLYFSYTFNTVHYSCYNFYSARASGMYIWL